MYQRVITPSAIQSLKRLPQSVQDELLRTSEILRTNPYAGEKLHKLSPFFILMAF